MRLDIIIGAMISLLSTAFGAFMSYYLNEKKLRGRALLELREELRDNLEILIDFKKRAKKQTAIPPIYTDAYISARSLGLLTNLPKDVRKKLAHVYLKLLFLKQLSLASTFGLLLIEDWNKFVDEIERLINEINELLNKLGNCN